MRYRPLNIRHGNGAAIVVRARESLVHVGYNVICNGEGWQLTYLIQLMANDGLETAITNYNHLE